jgi:hypothetical protein
MDVDLDVGMAPVEAFLFVTDIAHRVTGDLLEMVTGDRLRSAHLARKNDPVGGHHGLNGDTRIGWAAR